MNHMGTWRSSERSRTLIIAENSRFLNLYLAFLGVHSKTLSPYFMRMSRFVAVLAAFAFFISGAAAATITHSLFTDVSVNHWAYPAIKWAVEAKVMKTAGEKLFKPDTSATRAEVAHASQQVYTELNTRLMVLEKMAGLRDANGKYDASAAKQAERTVKSTIVDARNAQRKADVNLILNAIYQYSIDYNGALPSTISSTVRNICSSGAESCTGVSLRILEGKYLPRIPKDPQWGDDKVTGYTIVKDATQRITVTAPYAEGSVKISVTR